MFAKISCVVLAMLLGMQLLALFRSSGTVGMDPARKMPRDVSGDHQAAPAEAVEANLEIEGAIAKLEAFLAGPTPPVARKPKSPMEIAALMKKVRDSAAAHRLRFSKILETHGTLVREEQLEFARTKYGRYLASKISGPVFEQALALIADTEMARLDVASLAGDNALSKEKREQLSTDIVAGIETELRELLGSDGYADFNRHRADMTADRETNMMADRLTAGGVALDGKTLQRLRAAWLDIGKWNQRGYTDGQIADLLQAMQGSLNGAQYAELERYLKLKRVP